ncbi:MAG: sulfurtransferase [Solirubrobacterales bacterium]|nr:sulfurtransferase [Solirubrobacterales bacterium]
MSTATFNARAPHSNTALVDPSWIASRLADPSVRVVEVDVSRAAFDTGQIPGAVFWNAYGDLRPVDYRPLDAARFADLLSRSGIGPDTAVVFYGYAAYLGFWLMRSYGHASVFLMDGPREQWAEAGYAWSNEAVRVPPVAYPAPGARHEAVTREDVLGLLGDPDVTLLDVRSLGEFTGEQFWPSGAAEDGGRAGHIPGARWLPVEAVRDEAEDVVRNACGAVGVVPGRHVVVYCTIGNRASLVWFVLRQRLGFPRVSVYYGSWAEWGTAGNTPVDTGPPTA